MIIYIDELLIHTQTKEENLKLLYKILPALEDMGLRLTLDKTQLVKEEVRFLGHTIQEHIISMTEETRENI